MFYALVLLFVTLPFAAIAQMQLGGEPTLPEGMPAWVYALVPLALSSIFRLISVIFKSNNVVMQIIDFLALSWYRARVDPERQK